ncbi:RDD family protein [Pseudaestuariivita rosea]|uniref:RDD family protein n=1 Tax=Pseudaestuariivita rosea TaxID=2763263 RepID=UPI001ABAE62E|nr:RDD family protein [Pseudaestuariivita rosea]
MSYENPYRGLPDPDYQSEFYSDIPTKRFFAWVVDVFIVTLIVTVISLLSLGVGFFFFFLLMFLIGFAYRVITLSGQSATLGMRLVAIELRTSSGSKFDTGMAFLHTIGYYMSMGFALAQFVSIILMLATPRRQGLTDHVLGTVALNRAAES